MFVSHGNIFCNGNKNATSLYETAFLIGVSIFSVNRKRIVLLTLFCLLKNRNNGNFTVPIHKIPVMALLIIRIINFRFRFKRGADVYFNSEVLEYLGDKISNSPRLSLRNGYDVRSWPLILSPIEFARFHCENKLTLPCSICRPTNIENICGKCKSRASFLGCCGCKIR